MTNPTTAVVSRNRWGVPIVTLSKDGSRYANAPYQATYVVAMSDWPAIVAAVADQQTRLGDPVPPATDLRREVLSWVAASPAGRSWLDLLDDFPEHNGFALLDIWDELIGTGAVRYMSPFADPTDFAERIEATP